MVDPLESRQHPRSPARRAAYARMHGAARRCQRCLIWPTPLSRWSPGAVPRGPAANGHRPSRTVAAPHRTTTAGALVDPAAGMRVHSTVLALQPARPGKVGDASSRRPSRTKRNESHLLPAAAPAPSLLLEGLNTFVRRYFDVADRDGRADAGLGPDDRLAGARCSRLKMQIFGLIFILI